MKAPFYSWPTALLLINISLLIRRLLSNPSSLICRDPDAGGTTQNKNRKFLIFGNDNSDGAGLGNLLIFFPSAYYFAAFTGRDIIISDRSTIGEMCSVITCGFPFASELALAFPQYLGGENLRWAPVVKAFDFSKYADGKVDLSSQVVLRASGYQALSDWWVYHNMTTLCVRRITGCDLGDVACADRHAFQRLIRGPFKASLSEKEEKRISGVPKHIKHAILTLPHAYAPRIDVAIHIRAQFHGFEKLSSPDDPGYQREVSDWIQSKEATSVFAALEGKMIAVLEEARVPQNGSVSAGTTSHNAEADQIYVYLASDNEKVKENFTSFLSTSSTRLAHSFNIRIMSVDTKFVHHVKNLVKMKKATDNEGLLDLVFDWYALSLTNVVLAWRKGSTGVVSTFVQSAQRVSGTTERTDVFASPGHGIGTRGYQLTKDRRGNAKWNMFWTYSFLDDYQKAT